MLGGGATPCANGFNLTMRWPRITLRASPGVSETWASGCAVARVCDCARALSGGCVESKERAAMPKKIVVFADGTGNAFSTQESNVWRLYCALDQTSSDQIAHYIEGVGTSGFRPFALLDGATGIGVPSNV